MAPALVLAASCASLLIAGGLHLIGAATASRAMLAIPAFALLFVLAGDIISSLRRGEIGLDLLAGLSMTGALAIGEILAAAIVALMYAGGRFLEASADRRARRALTRLVQAAPRRAVLSRRALVDLDPGEIVAGDRLLIRRGETVPVDGSVLSGEALLDTSTLTGEALPQRFLPGAAVLSGTINAGDAFDLLAGARAADSAYAGILRLVEDAQRARAPMSRLADRYALGFLGLALAITIAAWWTSGEAVRAVAVLVVATPCPLILAVPVALTAGLSRAAAEGVLVKGAGALERLSRIDVVLLDKTGTLTGGARPAWCGSWPRVTSMRTRYCVCQHRSTPPRITRWHSRSWQRRAVVA